MRDPEGRLGRPQWVTHPPHKASPHSLSQASDVGPGWHHLCAWGWWWCGGRGGSSLTRADALRTITRADCMPAVRPGDMIDTRALGGVAGLQVSVLSAVHS